MKYYNKLMQLRLTLTPTYHPELGVNIWEVSGFLLP